MAGLLWEKEQQDTSLFARETKVNVATPKREEGK